VGEEVVELRAAEDEDDCVIQQATPPSFSASNPSVLYEATQLTVNMNRSATNHSTSTVSSTSSRILGHRFLFYTNLSLKEEIFNTCFNDYTDLMVAARVGKNGYVK